MPNQKMIKLGPFEIPAPPDLAAMFQKVTGQKTALSEERAITIELIGAINTAFHMLTVRTDMGDFDILAGATPRAHYGAHIFVLADIKNIGDIPGGCAITCEYPIGTVLWSHARTLEPGATCGIACISECAKHYFTMPATPVTVRVSCTP